MVSYIGAAHHLTHIQIVVHHFSSIWGTVVHSLLHQAKLLGSANGKKNPSDGEGRTLLEATFWICPILTTRNSIKYLIGFTWKKMPNCCSTLCQAWRGQCAMVGFSQCQKVDQQCGEIVFSNLVYSGHRIWEGQLCTSSSTWLQSKRQTWHEMQDEGVCGKRPGCTLHVFARVHSKSSYCARKSFAQTNIVLHFQSIMGPQCSWFLCLRCQAEFLSERSKQRNVSTKQRSNRYEFPLGLQQVFSKPPSPIAEIQTKTN